MARKAVTSKRVATISSHVLTDKKEDISAKSSAGSALAQTPESHSASKTVGNPRIGSRVIRVRRKRAKL